MLNIFRKPTITKADKSMYISPALLIPLSGANYGYSDVAIAPTILLPNSGAPGFIAGIAIPNGAVSIKQLSFFIEDDGAGDFVLRWILKRHAISSTGTTIGETSTAAYATLTTGFSNSGVIKRFNVPTGALSSLLNFTTDNLLTININRNSGDAGDTYTTDMELTGLYLELY